MQVAASPRPTSDEIVVRPGESLPTPAPQDINDPAPRFMRVYSSEVFSLLGAIAFGYSSSSPDEIKVRFTDYDFAKLADGILKDTVLGARLVMADRDGTPYDMTKVAADWVSYPTNAARQVAAMPGVTSYRWFGNRQFLFTTDTTESRVKLQQLVERKLGVDHFSYWKGECFGPGCKPDPAPPTGEV